MRLPTYSGTLERYSLTGEPLVPRAPEVPLTRTAFAAAHVISDPMAERIPWDTRPPWTGTPLSPSGRAFGTRAFTWPKPWIPRRGAWGSTGPRRWS
jgi:hypothetical protein